MSNFILDAIRNSDCINSEIVAFEAFLRRVVLYDLPFMLKGSLITRQYMPSTEIRNVEDIDWVYLNKITVDEANKIFTDWMIKVTETELDDGVKFRSFSQNAFWRGIDYAMADDFPTVQALVNECDRDKIYNKRILNLFTKKGLEEIFFNSPTNSNLTYSNSSFYDYYFKTHIGFYIGSKNTKEKIYNFIEQFYNILNNAGFNETLNLPVPKYEIKKV